MSLLLLLTGTPSGGSTPSGYRVTEIPTALLGTGKSLLVWDGTKLKQRVTTEGTPVVIVNGSQLRALQSGETLQS